MKSLLGSKRSRFFREPRGGRFVFNAPKRRAQHVKFRKRYVTSLARRVSTGIGWAILLGGVGAAAVFGGRASMKFWRTSPLVRATAVQFSDDVPAGLAEFLALHVGDNVFQIHPARMEQEALLKFPELESLSTRRTLDRRILVRGKFRKPVFRIQPSPNPMGVDEQGILFPIKTANRVPDSVPVLAGAGITDRASWILFAKELEQKLPEFYSLVKRVETDKIHGNIVELIRKKWWEKRRGCCGCSKSFLPASRPPP
jgi:hypothetical protein